MVPIRHYAKAQKDPWNFWLISKKIKIQRGLVVCMGSGDGLSVGGTGQGSRQLWWSIWESKVNEGFCYFWLFPCCFIMELQMEGIRRDLSLCSWVTIALINSSENVGVFISEKGALPLVLLQSSPGRCRIPKEADLPVWRRSWASGPVGLGVLNPVARGDIRGSVLIRTSCQPH